MKKVISSLCLFFLSFAGCGYMRHLWIPTRLHTNHVSTEYSYFRAATESVDITPDHNVWLAGYHPGRKSTGVHDPIEARILTIQDTRGHIVVLVTVDLLGFLKSDTDTLRRLVDDPALDIFVLSSHNHSSPDLIGIYGPTIWRVPMLSGRDEAYIDDSIKKISLAIRGTIQSLVPVTISFSRSQPHITVSDVESPDNDFDVWMVASIETEQIIGTLVVAGCHPTTLVRGNTLLTSDFPGAMRDMLDKELRTRTLFINSAPGSVTYDPKSRAFSTFARRQDVGRTFAEAARETLKDMRLIAPSPVRVRRSVVVLPMTNPLFVLGGLLGYIPNDAWLTRTTEVSALTIGDITIVTVPGELFPSLSQEIKGWSAGTTEIWALANDEIGYIFRKEDFDKPAFSYWRGVSLGPDTGPLIMEHAYKNIKAVQQ